MTAQAVSPYGHRPCCPSYAYVTKLLTQRMRVSVMFVLVLFSPFSNKNTHSSSCFAVFNYSWVAQWWAICILQILEVQIAQGTFWYLDAERQISNCKYKKKKEAQGLVFPHPVQPCGWVSSTISLFFSDYLDVFLMAKCGLDFFVHTELLLLINFSSFFR